MGSRQTSRFMLHIGISSSLAADKQGHSVCSRSLTSFGMTDRLNAVNSERRARNLSWLRGKTDVKSVTVRDLSSNRMFLHSNHEHRSTQTLMRNSFSLGNDSESDPRTARRI